MMRRFMSVGEWVDCGRPTASLAPCAARIVLALCLALALSAAGAPGTAAQGEADANLATVTRCEPELVWAATTEQAVVCIYVEDVVGLYGADFEMSFPGMLGIATVVDQDGATPEVEIARSDTWVPSGWVVFINSADNSTGYLHFLVYGWNPAPVIDGSGPVACVTFQPTTAGHFTLTFTRHDLSNRDGWLIDNTAHTCSVTFSYPTSVIVSRFAARPAGRAIRIQWETTQEVDNLGFNLYRATRIDGPRTLVNEDLIPSLVNPGNPSGAVYEYTDMVLTLRKCKTYFYWLEEVSIHGHTTLHGPVKAEGGEVPADWSLIP